MPRVWLPIDVRGQSLRLTTFAFEPCHIIGQLGSELDSVDGAKAVILEQTFRLS
jgi:hypothetical protein